MIHPLRCLPVAISLCLAMNTMAQPTPYGQYGTNGATNTDIGSGADLVTCHVLRPDGELLLGTFHSNTGIHIGLMCIDTTCGMLDPTFGNGGKVAHQFELVSTLLDLKGLPDGRFLVAGQNADGGNVFNFRNAVYRFNTDGSPDTSFDHTGWRADRLHPLSGGLNTAVFPLAGGRVAAVGISSFNNNGGVPGIGAVRYKANGEPDSTFSQDGIAWYPLPVPYFYHVGETALMLADSSLLYIGGVGNDIDPYTIHLAKILPTGELDATFGNAGQLVTSLTYGEANAQRRIAAVLLPDGRFLLGVRSANQQAMVACFMADGTLDTSYGLNGISEMDPTTGNDIANGLQLLADGSTLQFGSGTNASGHFILKRTATGQADASFGVNGVLPVPDLTGDTYLGGGCQINAASIIAYGYDSYPTEVALTVKMSTAAPVSFAELGPDTGFCPGSSVVLDAGNPGSTYLWNNNSTAQELLASAQGSYHVAITDALGCTDRDTIQITAWAQPNIPVIIGDASELYTTALGNIQWYLDGTAIPGATAETWVPQENGTYTTTDTDPFTGCSSTSAPFDVLNVGVHDLGRPKVEVSVAPNPLTDASVVSFRLDKPGKVSIQLLDATGRSVYTAFTGRHMAAGTQRVMLGGLTELNAGKYLLNITSPEGRSIFPVVR